MNFFNYNGRIYPENETVIGPSSRGLRYGDGLFETMKLHEGRVILADDHFARLKHGISLLRFDLPKFWSQEKMLRDIIFLAAKNKLSSARIRITVIRGEGGMYDTVNNNAYFIIEAGPLPENCDSFNINGLQLCIFEDAKKSIDAFSNLKHNNALPYFMGAMFAKQLQCNDAFILNSHGNICEATIANVFLIKEGIISTPALSEGCIAGVVRNWLVKKLREESFTVLEASISKADALNADEIFLTNSIFNIRWVGNVGEKRYTNTTIQKICNILQTARANKLM